MASPCVWLRRLIIFGLMVGMLAGLMVDTDHNCLTDDFPPATLAVMPDMPAPTCRRRRRRPGLPPALIRRSAVADLWIRRQGKTIHRWVALLARWKSVYSTGPPT